MKSSLCYLCCLYCYSATTTHVCKVSFTLATKCRQCGRAISCNCVTMCVNGVVVVRGPTVGTADSWRQAVRRHWTNSDETLPTGRQSPSKTIAYNSRLRVSWCLLSASLAFSTTASFPWIFNCTWKIITGLYDTEASTVLKLNLSTKQEEMYSLNQIHIGQNIFWGSTFY